ncbi:MAG TPA: tetratricopeptide repeat protein [Rhizomicrobium sp.]|nr:tetratricopeptide repeat protein [Rhizomicrobium sp.]
MSDALAAVPAPEIEARVRLAQAHLDRKELHLAEQLLFEALSAEPNHAAALHLMGFVRRQQGVLAEAEALYRRSLEIDPDQPQVHHNLGSLLKALARLDEAIAAYREAIRRKPNYAEAHLDLALVLSERGENEEAEKSCRAALRIQPNYLLAKQTLAAVLCALGRSREAERLVRQALALGIRNPRQAAALEHNLAIALDQQGRHAEALALYDGAKAKAPDMSSVDYNRGNALQHLGRFEEAVESYRRAVARYPLDMSAHQELNELLYRLGDDEEFLRSYDQAALLYPDVGEIYLEKAKLLYLRGDYGAARELFERARAFLPDSIAAQHGLAVVLTHLNEPEAAATLLESLVRAVPGNTQFWRNYAQALLAAGDPRAALAAAEQALALEPDSQIALAVWGLVLRVLGDAREERMNDVENLVRVYEIPPPGGYSSMDDFNHELNEFLDGLHRDRREAIDQTLRMGTQTPDNLFGKGHGPVELLRARIDDAIADYITRMPDDAGHPLFRRRAHNFEYSASWSSRLHDCGYHTNHVHPKGWISSAYYIALPDAVGKPGSNEGWIKFGEPNLPCGIRDAVRRAVQPRAGRLVLFPSYMWHGTIPFHSAQSRTTIAFDAVPIG